jgi:Zn-dependent metalloprotease
MRIRDGSGRAIVTEPVRHMEVAVAMAGAELQVEAIDYVRSFQDSLDSRPLVGDDYDVTAIAESDGMRPRAHAQTYAGVPVVGSQIVVHADDATFLGFNGYVTKNLDGFDITTTVSDDEAMAIAKADLAGDTPLEFSNEATGSSSCPGRTGGASIAWHVTFDNSKRRHRDR